VHYNETEQQAYFGEEYCLLGYEPIGTNISKQPAASASLVENGGMGILQNYGNYL
jgi:hypothetical protein